MTDRDYLWLHIKDLPYFRSIVRAVEAGFYQKYRLIEPVLDVGCGDGHFATVAFDRKIDVGIDPWTGPIQEARRRGGYLSVVQGDGGKMPFPDETFGSALSNSVLEHIPHIDLVLGETARVLKPGAPFLFCVPNPAYYTELSISRTLQKVGADSLSRRYVDWFGKISRVEHADWPDVWQDRLERAGLVLERWWHYLSPQAWRAVEWGHYFGVPSLFTRKLFGRWIVAPTRWNLALTERYTRKYAQVVEDPQGTFTFFVARKPE